MAKACMGDIGQKLPENIIILETNLMFIITRLECYGDRKTVTIMPIANTETYKFSRYKYSFITVVVEKKKSCLAEAESTVKVCVLW